MDINLDFCTRTGRTISQKTMEDGNISNTRDDNNITAAICNLYSDRSAILTANGHSFAGEPSSPPEKCYEQRRHSADTSHDDKFKKRINPLRIHLGKRPFVDNSVPFNNVCKKKKPLTLKPNTPRAPKLIPKRPDPNKFHSVTSQLDDNEQDKPVPRLVLKSQLSQFKKSKVEKTPQLKEYAQSLGLQPMVKFKCRKCCSMSFKTLALLKKHQLVCRAQVKEPALSPEGVSHVEINSSGPSRVTRKVYFCSACHTYYENWNLFLHMREVHNRHICLFCLGMFSKAEKLSSHLTNKHNVQEFNYNNKEEFCNIYKGSFYLMCCACDEICSEKDDFFNHDCNNVKPKPVPVLISKNSLKPNNLKPIRNSNENITNGPLTKELYRPNGEKKDCNEQKIETITTQTQKAMSSSSVNNCENVNSDVSFSSINSNTDSKDTSNTSDSAIEMESPSSKPLSPKSTNSLEPTPNFIPNGDEKNFKIFSNDCDSPSTSDVKAPAIETVAPKPEEPHPPTFEKECGIKLKLSLNSAKSPVIINSTVDPTIGQQYSQNMSHKPPTRNRRPPKRYEKDKPPEPTSLPKTPSIKMTICDKADSPFVKTTFYENNKETTLVNNNIESIYNTPDVKPENTIKTTIYDNKIEEVNTLNRVPKLTVRVPKEFLDKASSSDESSDSDNSEKLTVDETLIKPENTNDKSEVPLQELQKTFDSLDILNEISNTETEKKLQDEEDTSVPEVPAEVTSPKQEVKSEPQDQEAADEINVEEITPMDSTPATELTLDRAIDKYPLKDLLKVFLGSTYFNCIFCNHARKIAVNCGQLAMHMVEEHKFSATVNSITAEELMPETIAAKVKAGVEEVSDIFINLDSYDSVDKCENVQNSLNFECFQCYFKTAIHKDLYLHNRKMHQKTILLCVMCKNNFYTYSELLCHLCPGTYDSDYVIKYRCCFCNVDSISSSFRLMVHLRKIHHTCDVCLEFCQSQARLSNHVWKHKLHHLCFRCGIAYRNKPDINNHLFWKHGTESVLCKRCLQKKWPHVYHFCNPPAVFVCEECNLQFTRAICLKVHKRFHSGEFPHVCTEEGCDKKFVSKKLLNKHREEHTKMSFTEKLDEEKPDVPNNNSSDTPKEIPVIDLVNDVPNETETETKTKVETELTPKKSKKKKLKERDALLLDVNLPALNLSESDSSDESDSGLPPSVKDDTQDKPVEDTNESVNKEENEPSINKSDDKEKNELDVPKVDEKVETLEDEKPCEQQVLQIWDNFQKYNLANNVEPPKEKTPPPVRRRHVCESDHDYCLIPADMNGDDDLLNSDKKKSKKSPKKKHGDFSSSSSSSSDSDSSCSCGSNCSCSSSSGSSSSSSSDSDSSDSGNEQANARKMRKLSRKTIPNRRLSNGSNVDVMGMTETPVLVPEKTEPLIAETDLETDESETDEEFYDSNPQLVSNQVHNEKRNLLLASVGSADNGSISGEVSRCVTPIKEDKDTKEEIEPKDNKELKDEKDFKEEKDESKEKSSSSRKKSKKKKKSKSSKKHGPIKINIPKDVIAKSKTETPPPLIPNKITISLQSNTVQIPQTPEVPNTPNVPQTTKTPSSGAESKRASKRRRVPNKFYGYSSDEEHNTPAALKPQLPPKLEWRKEDLPSPTTHKSKKELPSSVIPQKVFNYNEPIRLTAPVPDPEPPRFLMNSESMESSDSDSSEEGALEIYQPGSVQNSSLPPPTYLNSGTSSLPYPFQRPAVREAKEGESVYCYCRCPYDEVSEMIACDAEGCPIEWFHFECVGIMVPPKGKWYCPECRKNQNFSGYR